MRCGLLMAQSFSPNSPETNTPLGYEVKRTLWLAGPLIVGQLTNFGMNFVDTVMAGRLGTVDLGAIAVGSSIWAAGFLFVLGLLLAVSAAVSRLDGAGERDRVGEFVRQALWLGLVLGVGLWAFARSGEWVMTRMDVTPQVATLAMDYLRAISWGAPALVGMLVLRFFSEGTGKTGPTMYVGMLGIACNIPLNAVLMFGLMGFPKLGAVGAGWATAIVFWLQFLAFLGWVTHRPHYKKYQVWACFSPPDRREISALVKLGLPIGIMVFLEGGMFVGSALLIGTLGALPVAAHQVAMNYAGLVFMVPVGLAGAITVRVGNALGRGEPVAAQRAGRIGIALALTFAMVSAAVIIAIPDGGELVVFCSPFSDCRWPAGGRCRLASRVQRHPPADGLQRDCLLGRGDELGRVFDLQPGPGAQGHVDGHHRRIDRGFGAARWALYPGLERHHRPTGLTNGLLWWWHQAPRIGD
jgi:MATE family multidrug resistance protein